MAIGKEDMNLSNKRLLDVRTRGYIRKIDISYIGINKGVFWSWILCLDPL
jgi:hypothetical protein